MGRDYVTLLNWAETGKPPLLGPQTSVVSYNQSAWYFYILMPLFYLSNYWAFSSTLTLILFAVGVYAALSYTVRKDENIFYSVSLCMALLAIQPQAVLQNRFIWNPSFVPYFLLISLTSLVMLRKNLSNFWLAAFWIGVGFAVGFSYSTVPLAVLLVGYLFVSHYRYWMRLVAFGAATAGLVLLPLLAFEARHDFTLTRLFITGQTTPQNDISLTIKNALLQRFLFPGIQTSATVLLLIGFIAAIILSLRYFWQNKRTEHFHFLAAFSTILLLLVASIYFLPVNIEKHYIFPLLTLGFFVISLLRKRFALLFAVILACYWMNPANSLHSQTFQPAIRSVSEMQQCYQEVCRDFRESAYVSMESGILAGYHNAPEHQFFLRDAGCHILDIEASQDQAKSMFVIEDKGRFDPGNSGYRELTLFGTYTLGFEKKCTETLSIKEIRKPNVSENSQETVFEPQ